MPVSLHISKPAQRSTLRRGARVLAIHGAVRTGQQQFSALGSHQRAEAVGLWPTVCSGCTLPPPQLRPRLTEALPLLPSGRPVELLVMRSAMAPAACAVSPNAAPTALHSGMCRGVGKGVTWRIGVKKQLRRLTPITVCLRRDPALPSSETRASYTFLHPA